MFAHQWLFDIMVFVICKFDIYWQIYIHMFCSVLTVNNSMVVRENTIRKKLSMISYIKLIFNIFIFICLWVCHTLAAWALTGSDKFHHSCFLLFCHLLRVFQVCLLFFFSSYFSVLCVCLSHVSCGWLHLWSVFPGDCLCLVICIINDVRTGKQGWNESFEFCTQWFLY